MSDWTPELAGEIRERCEAATPGPLEADVDYFSEEDDGIMVVVNDLDYSLYFLSSTDIAPQGNDSWEKARASQQYKDAVFFAHARTDLPVALDRVEAQDEEIERLNDFIADLKEMADKNPFYDRNDLREGVARALRGVSPLAGEHGR